MLDRPCPLVFRPWLLSGLVLLIAMATLVIRGPLAMSQEPAPKAASAPPTEYTTIEIDETQKQNQILVNKLLTGGTVPPEQIKFFTDYYQTYIFARWTHPGYYDGALPEKRRTDLRKDLRNDFMRCAGKPSHATLMTVALDQLPTFVNTASYHPIVRYNAMLAIGDLNQREPKPRIVTIPLPQALPILLTEVSNPKQIVPVKIAALIGLKRHALFGIADPAKQEELTKQLISIAQDPEAIFPKASVAGQVWVRTLAVETLGLLEQPSSQGVIIGTLVQLIAEKNGPLPLRCSAAIALGKTNLTGVENVDPARMTVALTQLTSDICTEEIRLFTEAKQREQEEIDPLESTSRRFRKQKDEKKEYLSRPRVTAALDAVSKGLDGTDDQRQGVRALAHPVGKPIADALAEAIKELIRAADKEELEDEEIVELLDETRKEAVKHLEKLPEKTPPPAAATPAQPLP